MAIRHKLTLKKHHKVLAGKLLYLALSLGIFGAGLTVLWVANLKIPDFNIFEDRQVTQSTKIYDRTGEILLYNMGEDIRRTVLTADKISRHIKNASVAIEDAEFYEHKGVKPTAILRATLANIGVFLGGNGLAQGGSTITQQVIKNTLLTQERTISRKLKEWVLALKLERNMSKSDILTVYLNESPYGGNIYGVEEASQAFFSKPALDVSLAQAAYLAALPQAPTYYSPYGNNKADLDARAKLVLRRMLELGFITQTEYAEVDLTQVKFSPQNNFAIKAPHFVLYVRDYLEKKYGKELVTRGGLKVTTTLDWEMQRNTEEIAKSFAETNEKNFNAHNMGVVAMDPNNGQILVMLGSRDYFEDNNYANYNIAFAKRQPGSSFKPFVYATAFKRGYTPDTTVFDLPTQFQTTCSPIVSESISGQCYTPGNFDNVFRGPMTLRDALAQSINIPAIKVLYLAGMQNALATARDLGITTLGNANQYGLTLVLGGGEVTLLELVTAYGGFASDGYYNPYTPILKVEGADGKTLEEFRSVSKRALDENIAREINDILSDNTARAPSFGQNSPLNFPNMDVATKTGTTNDYRDMWTVGYTPNIVIGAWVGNNDNTSMEKRVAGFVVAPMWRQILLSLIANRPTQSFVRPDYPYKNDPNFKPVLRGIWQGGEIYVVDKITGKLATVNTPEELRVEQPVTSVHSILHWVTKTDPLGPVPTNPNNDPQYIFWETPVRLWAIAKGLTQNENIIPTEEDPVHKPEYNPIITITTSELTRINPNSLFTLSFTVEPKLYPLGDVEIYLNGHYVGGSKTPINNFSFLPTVDNLKDRNELKVVYYDVMRNRGQATIILDSN